MVHNFEKHDPEMPEGPEETLEESLKRKVKNSPVSRSTYDRLSKSYVKVQEENAELRLKITELDLEKSKTDLRATETIAVDDKAKEERNAATRALSVVVDGFRSTSINVHKNDHHLGPYSSCDHRFCRESQDHWSLIGGEAGCELAGKDPDTFWQQRREDLMPLHETSGPVVDLADLSVMITDEKPSDEFLETLEDPELAEQFPGKRLRRLHVPPPNKERDPSDPGMPKAKV